MRNYILGFIIFLACMILCTGCEVIGENPSLSAPALSCPARLTWKGITPGVSSEKDVINLLGQPAMIGIAKFENVRVRYYAYPVESGFVKEFLPEDRVYFTSAGVVGWVQTVSGDRDAKIHEVKEIADQLGYSLDTVLMNQSYKPNSKTSLSQGVFDVHGGPDHIYIWAHCGMAVLGLPGWHPDPSGQIVYSPESISSENTPQDLLVLREPFEYNADQRIANSHSIVLVQYFFPPTSYNDFKEYFYTKIYYRGSGFWDGFIKKYNQAIP
jgi:hypothetical protein